MNNGADNTGIDRTPRLSTLAELDFLDPVGMNWSGYEPNSSSTYHGSANKRQHKSGTGPTGVKPMTIHGCSVLVACLTFGRRQAVTCISNYERIYSDKDISCLKSLLP